MKIYDISMTIEQDMTVYKNRDNKRPTIENQSNFDTGSAYESVLKMNLHTGTHIDAPLHMIKNGRTMETYNLDQFISPCQVIDLTNVADGISKKDLSSFKLKKNHFVLLKTKNSYDTSFNRNFIYLTDSGAKYLLAQEISGVGIDALGIERSQPEHPTHKALLSQNCPILEGLRLKDVPAGSYQLVALPLKIKEVEASPTRAVLISEKG